MYGTLPITSKPAYLACPYSSKDPEIRQHRYELVTELAGALMRKGHIIYSPLTHNHIIAETQGLPTDWSYWSRFDRAMIEACDRLFVYTIPGWRSSTGVTAEIEIADELLLPIHFITPDQETDHDL